MDHSVMDVSLRHHAKCKPYYPRSSTSPLRLILAFSPVNDRNWANVHQQTAWREPNTELQNYIEPQENCWQNIRQGTGICRHQDLPKTDHIFSFILLAILGVIKVLQYRPLNLYQLTREKSCAWRPVCSDILLTGRRKLGKPHSPVQMLPSWESGTLPREHSISMIQVESWWDGSTGWVFRMWAAMTG